MILFIREENWRIRMRLLTFFGFALLDTDFAKLDIAYLDCDSLSNCFIIERRQDRSSREILRPVPA